MSAEPAPKLARILEGILARVDALPQPELTNEDLKSLHFLFGQNLARALAVVDQGGVRCFEGQASGRRVYQVQAKGSSAPPYVVLAPPSHGSQPHPAGGEGAPLPACCYYCSCQAFYYEAVSRAEAALCKHQIAALLASALRRCPVEQVPDELIADVMLMA